jgi:phosphopantetheinyl transferase (holo-ACP synthase)
VDWKDPANAQKSRDSRYLKKILTAAEIEFVRGSRNPDVTLWSLWACKETAYKVISKSSASAAFLPRRWPVKLNQEAFTPVDGEIVIPEQNKVFVQLLIAESYVHCIGSDNLSVLGKIIRGVDRLPPSEEEKIVDPSQFGRTCLIRRLAVLDNLNFAALSIRRTQKDGELQPPCVYLDNKEAPFDISLSHDGQFTAYAFIKKSGLI